jgi:hypothetical protein
VSTTDKNDAIVAFSRAFFTSSGWHYTSPAGLSFLLDLPDATSVPPAKRHCPCSHTAILPTMVRTCAVVGFALLCHAADPTLTPDFQRLDLQPNQIVHQALTIAAAAGTMISAAVVDCACIHCETPLPLTVPAAGWR